MSEAEKPHLPPDDLKIDWGEIVKEATDPKRLADFQRQEDERHVREMRERAAKARADAIVLFVTWGKSPDHWWVCPWCAALVNDREKHLDFHGHLNSAALDAHEAVWRSRPIG